MSIVLALLAIQEETYRFGHSPKFTNIAFESETDLETIIGMTNEVSGTLKADFEKGTGSVSITVPVRSLKTGMATRDEHLLGESWFHAEKHPDLTFVSKKVKKLDGGKVEVTGDFTMRGVAKEIAVAVDWKPLPEEAVKRAKFPDGKWVRFSASFEVKLSDHGIKISGGAIGKVSDTVRVKMVLFAGTAMISKK